MISYGYTPLKYFHILAFKTFLAKLLYQAPCLAKSVVNTTVRFSCNTPAPKNNLGYIEIVNGLPGLNTEDPHVAIAQNHIPIADAYEAGFRLRESNSHYFIPICDIYPWGKFYEKRKNDFLASAENTDGGNCLGSTLAAFKNNIDLAVRDLGWRTRIGNNIRIYPGIRNFFASLKMIF